MLIETFPLVSTGGNTSGCVKDPDGLSVLRRESHFDFVPAKVGALPKRMPIPASAVASISANKALVIKRG